MKETDIQGDGEAATVRDLDNQSIGSRKGNSNKQAKAGTNLDTTLLFKSELVETLKQHYNQIREECLGLEDGMKTKQAEVIKKKEVAFQLARNESEVNQLKAHQSTEINQAKSCFETFMASKANSRKYKALNRSFLLQAKLRDLKIIQQESNSALANRMEQVLLENRLEFADTVTHVEEIHAKKCKNLTDQQESHNRTEKAVYDLEISHLNEDLRAVMVKRYLVKQNHKKILDKKTLDQLKELQARELKHIKELFDFKLISTDSVFHLKQKHQDEIQTLDIKHYKERKEHEETLTNLREAFQQKLLEEHHQHGLKQVSDAHRSTLGNLASIHSQRLTSVQQTPTESTIQRVYLNLFKWGECVFEETGYEYGFDIEAFRNSENPDIKTGISQITSCEEGLRLLKEKQAVVRKGMLAGHAAQVEQAQAQQQQEMLELKIMQDAEIQQLKKQHDSEISELKIVHDREVAMEQSIHDAECEALTERRILSSVLDSVIDGIIIIDTNAIIRRLNSAVERIFDYKADEIVGKNINMLMPHELAKRHDEIISNYLKTGKRSVIGIGRKLLGKRKNGQLFNIHLSVTEVKQEGVHLFTGVIRDITNESLQEEMAQEQRKRDEELQTMTLAAEKKRADEAEQSRKQQERYIDMICHEIRNPLNGIQNNNELLSELLKDISNHLKQNSVEDEQIDKILSASANAVSAISHCAKHQKSIADDVLNMSKLSMSLIRISNSTPIDPIALTNTIFDTFRVEAKKKKLDLVLSVKAGLESLMSEYQISSDPARLSQILINLIANSIKFTEKQPIRRITVEIDAFEVKEDDSTTQMLKFGVGDTGIGMTEAEQAHLFQQFSQASYKTYADYGGSGLGLYISKELIILMGGSINVTSKKGVGTTMIFTVKVNKSKKVAVDAVGENNSPNTENTAEGASSEKWAGMTKSIKLNPNTKGKPILVVDDNTINRKVLKAHLERAGFACDEVEDGKQALNKYIANPQKYCLVLMDLEMPVMDGLTSSRLIREEEARLIAANKLEYQVPIMAVTGNARYDPDHAPEHFGMQGVLLKPFTRNELLGIVHQFMDGGQAKESVTSQEQQQQ